MSLPIKSTATFIALLLMSVLLMQFVWSVSEPGKKGEVYPAQKVNLALRRTADALLREAGDSTSRIPPVEQRSANVWLVRLEGSFHYEQLPTILQTSFDRHGITGNYDVAVLRCVDQTLFLGYNFQDVSNDSTVPCSGRPLPPDCYNLQVTLARADPQREGLPLAGWFFSGLLAIILYVLGLRWLRLPKKLQETPPSEPEGLRFGQSRLDVANQQLECGNTSHPLTYREAKLLHLFAQHPNQVLERSFILENVWADEGVLVGRSVDMFVSRLRKMLRDDPSVQLTAVHGVGYRMEVS